MEPLVSIIVPVHRVQEYLPACLESICNQTHQNLQVVVVDDGSPDDCPAICDSFAAKDRRFNVIHQVNAGLSGARNAGLDAATGEFIAFVDGDDVLAPAFIETLLSAHADIAQCAFCTDVEHLRAEHDSPAFQLYPGKEASELLQFDGTGNFTVVWNKLYRATFWQDLRFPLNRRHEDEFVTYRLLWEAETFSITEAELYYYRQREGSIMSEGVTRASLDAIDALAGRATFYRERGEERLALLTECVELHRLQSMMSDVRKVLPSEVAGLTSLARELYWRIVRASQVPLRKKTSLTLRMRML